MQVQVTKARRVAGYRGPGHACRDMIFDDVAAQRPKNSHSRMMTGIGTPEQKTLRVVRALQRPWQSLKYDTNLGGYRTGITETQLKGAPKYSNDNAWDWADSTRTRSVNDYYGVAI
jgi:hypothetical protein